MAASRDSCCGGLNEFKCSICFSKSSTSLFDWAETDVAFALGLSENASVSVSMAVEMLGLTYLAVTFLLDW